MKLNSPLRMQRKVCVFCFLKLCLAAEHVSDLVTEVAPETRTSAPLTIKRNSEMTAIGFDRIYPAGEGAGYAGGITSAAVDGVKTALKIMARFEKNAE